MKNRRNRRRPHKAERCRPREPLPHVMTWPEFCEFMSEILHEVFAPRVEPKEPPEKSNHGF